MNLTCEYGALFDLDGVIVDSESQYTVFWDGIEKMYPTGIPDYAVAIKGTTLEKILNNYPDQAVRDDIVQRLNKFQEEDMDYPIYPGVETFLEELKRRGIPAAVVTSSDHRKMDVVYARHPRLKDYFEVIIDGSMVTRSKPDPQGYLLAASRIGRDPRHCFVFEDSLQGLKAGRASGAAVIGLATTYPAELLTDKADKIISGFEGFSVDSMLAVSRL